MAKIERTYNIPLRKQIMKVNRYRRTEKAIIAVKEFLAKHMKSENVKLGRFLNLFLWQNGIRNPPHTIKVAVVKEDDGKVTAELVDAPTAAKQEKKSAKKDAKDVKKAAEEGEKKIEKELKKVEEKTQKAKTEKAEKPAKSAEKPAAKKTAKKE